MLLYCLAVNVCSQFNDFSCRILAWDQDGSETQRGQLPQKKLRHLVKNCILVNVICVIIRFKTYAVFIKLINVFKVHTFIGPAEREALIDGKEHGPTTQITDIQVTATNA